MTGAGQDQQSGSRNGGCYIYRVLEFDELVMVAIHDQDWSGYRLQLRIGPVWLLCPHFCDLIEKGLIFFGRWRNDFVLLLSSCEAAGDGWSLICIVFHARCLGVRTESNNLTNAIG